MIKIYSATSIFIFASFLCHNLSAQENTVATGGEAKGNGGTVSYTIGQIDYTTQSGSTGTVSQGVQQAFEIYTVGINDIAEISLEILLYPNPTYSDVRLKIGSDFIGKLSYQLFDLNGRLLGNKNITEIETVIPTNNLASATYLLNIINEKQVVKSFKIIKNK